MSCECGCGLEVTTGKRFRVGHNSKNLRPLEDRLWEKVDKNGPLSEIRPDLGLCWIWKASTADGYGRISIDGSYCYVHVFLWEREYGPKPDGLELDHLCRVRQCVRVSHLELVTHRENCRRGEKGRLVTHCPQGHLYDEENTYIDTRGLRHCRTCKKEQDRFRSKQSLTQIREQSLERTKMMLKLREEGLTNPQIAKKLKVTPKSVDNMIGIRKRLLKLGLTPIPSPYRK